MVKQLTANNLASSDIRQITVRLPASVLAKLERLAAHAVQTKSQFLIKMVQEIPDVEGPENKPEPLTPLQLRIAAWFERRPTTRWTIKEKRAYRENAHLTPPEDVDTLERYYTARIPEETDYRRKDIGTLLNNWPGELDRARTFVAAISKKRVNVGQGWISASAGQLPNGRNLSTEEVKAGIAELRAKMGLPQVENPSVVEEDPPEDFEP